MGISKLDVISYRIFGKWLESKAWDYLKLQHELVQARIGIPFDVYVSRAYFVSMLLAFPSGLIAYITMPQNFGKYSFFLILFFSFFFGLIIYTSFLAYPRLKANLRARKIDIVLPHAVALMHALSRGSSDVIKFFEIVSSNDKIYGEVANEVKSALMDTKILNFDIRTALKNSTLNTPSENFKNLIESLSTLIVSGGNLSAFFLSKTEQYRIKALVENRAFVDALGLLSEIYVAGFAAGPLFIIVLLVVLGLIGSAYYSLLLIIVYLLIPGGALFFIIFISSLSKGTSSKFLRLGDSKEKSENLLLQKGILRMKIYYFLKNPLKKLIEFPEKVLYFSVPAALLFFIFTYSLDFDVNKMDDYIIFTALIAFIPYSLLVEAHFRRINQISKNFPEFLNRLASLHESGLTLAASLKRLASSNLGILNSEINKMITEIELHGSIAEAFRNLGKRIPTVAVQRVVVLIENAIKMTGNIKDTLAIAASDSMTARAMEEDRNRETKIHVVIIYIAFFVFLYVIYSLITGFFPQLPDVEASAVKELVGEGITFSGIDKLFFVRLFFHASVLMGFFSGLVAGEMGEGDARLGLKHSIIMTLAAYILFLFIA